MGPLGKTPSLLYLLVAGAGWLACSGAHSAPQPERISQFPLTGWNCEKTVHAIDSAGGGYARVLDAFHRAGVRPAIVEESPLKIIAAGRTAPPGSGSPDQQKSRLYLSIVATPSRPGTPAPRGEYLVGSGVYSSPVAIKPRELDALYIQSYRIAQTVLTSAGLDTLKCYKRLIDSS